MSYGSPDGFRLFALPEGALEGVGDPVIQARLDAVARRINRKLRGRGVTVPVTGDAADDLADVEYALAAWGLVTGYRGTPPDDPGVAGLRDLAKEAWDDIEEIAAGLQTTAATAAVGGGGMIQAIPPVDDDGFEEIAWWA